MLVEIDDSVVQSTDERCARFLEEAVTISTKGFHLVVASRAAAKLAAERAELSKGARSFYASLVDRLTSIGRLWREVSRKVCVTTRTREIVNEQGVILMPPELSDALLREPMLLCENNCDAELLLHLTRAALAPRLVSLTTRGGGGDTLAPELVKASADHLVFCVVDSDIRYPGAGMGQTAQKVFAIPNEQLPTSTRELLPVRAIENFIEFPHPREDAQKVLDAPGVAAVRDFLDLKRGVRICHLHVEKTDEERRFLKSVFTEKSCERGMCPTKQEDRKALRGDNCWLLRNLPRGTVDDLVNRIRDGSFNAPSSRDPDLLLRIGEWGLASPRVSAV